MSMSRNLSSLFKTGSSMLVLARGEVVSFKTEGRSCRISCVSGRVWVTAAGQSTDYLMAAGNEVTLPAGSKVVIEGLQESMARVQARAAERVNRPMAQGGAQGRAPLLLS